MRPVTSTFSSGATWPTTADTIGPPKPSSGIAIACATSPHFSRRTSGALTIDEDPKVLLAHARAWLDDLYVRPSCWGRPYSADSLNTKVRSVRAFFSWLSEEDYTPFHYLEKLERPVLGKKHPKALSGSQVDQVLLAPQLVPTTYLGIRNLAMVLVYLDTWCRLTEVTELDIRDVHLDDGWMKVLGKGKREAIVRLSSQTVEVLTRYIDQWRPKPKRGQTHLFLQKDGTNLGPRAVQSLMARIRGVDWHTAVATSVATHRGHGRCTKGHEPGPNPGQAAPHNIQGNSRLHWFGRGNRAARVRIGLFRSP